MVNGLSKVLPQNHWDEFVSGLASKPLGWFSPVWSQNHWDGFLLFGLKIGGGGFLWFDLKTGGDGFSRFGLKTGGGFLGWASKPNWWKIS
jgi:hypothetical protein